MSLYLTGSIPPAVRPRLDAGELGALVTPRSRYRVDPRWTWAADSGCFAPATYVGHDRYLTWLTGHHGRLTCLWATVPDVVGDHAATLDRWHAMAALVRAAGYAPAFVAQDGATPDTLPADAGAVFIGGTTSWKLSPAARELLHVARVRGLPTHVGRVNTWRRWALFHGLADTMDGTSLAFDPALPVHVWGRQTVMPL